MKDKTGLPREAQARAEHALFEAIASVRDPEEAAAFLRDLCTPAELQALVDRWAVVALLRRGLTYREIHDRTGVSVTTVGRVARFLETGFGGYRTLAERMDLR